MQRKNPRAKKVRKLSLYVTEEMANQLKIRAYDRMMSVNTWLAQAIIQQMLREDKIQ